jgi:hypothetical protein
MKNLKTLVVAAASLIATQASVASSNVSLAIGGGSNNLSLASATIGDANLGLTAQIGKQFGIEREDKLEKVRPYLGDSAPEKQTSTTFLDVKYAPIKIASMPIGLEVSTGKFFTDRAGVFLTDTWGREVFSFPMNFTITGSLGRGDPEEGKEDTYSTLSLSATPAPGGAFLELAIDSLGSEKQTYFNVGMRL